MILQWLEVKNLRLFSSVRLDLDPGVNLIVGPNGAGKTTLLEAVYLLGQGKSFRHREAGPLVRQGQSSLMVVAKLEDDEGHEHFLGVERNQKTFRARFDGEEVRRRSTLLRTLPLQIFNPNSHELVEAGPELRRQFIDQSLFHVEHEFHRTIQIFTRALKQRNRALREKDLALAKSFEPAFIYAAERLNHYRRSFIERLSPAVATVLKQLEPDLELEIGYRSGWREENLSQALEETRYKDLERGFTSRGPHRAELVLKSKGLPVNKIFSRGQQKLLIYAFGLAAANLVFQATARRPVLLADDLPSELDAERISRLMSMLSKSGFQVLVTALEGAPIKTDDVKVFHVEHGTLVSP